MAFSVLFLSPGGQESCGCRRWEGADASGEHDPRGPRVLGKDGLCVPAGPRILASWGAAGLRELPAFLHAGSVLAPPRHVPAARFLSTRHGAVRVAAARVPAGAGLQPDPPACRCH